MHIIPVIDLLDGQVVHAKHGERQRYQPIASKLTKSSKASDIVKAFLDLYPFQTLYIADLNAIQFKQADKHLETIEALRLQNPDIAIWLDAGISDLQQFNLYHSLNIMPVLGTESFSTLQQYQVLKDHLQSFVLSIDINQDGHIGPDALLEPSYWPDDVIIMTLSNVGSFNGVDLNTLQKYQHIAPQKNIYAAGGVRQIADLHKLASAKLQGALIASALHQKTISSDDLQQLMA